MTDGPHFTDVENEVQREQLVPGNKVAEAGFESSSAQFKALLL